MAFKLNEKSEKYLRKFPLYLRASAFSTLLSLGPYSSIAELGKKEPMSPALGFTALRGPRETQSRVGGDNEGRGRDSGGDGKAETGTSLQLSIFECITTIHEHSYFGC